MSKPHRSTQSTDAPELEFRSARDSDELSDLGLRIAESAVEATNRWFQLQREGTERMLAEWSARQRSLLKDMEKIAGASHPAQWAAEQSYTRMKRNLEVCLAWWDVTARTQDALLEAMRGRLGSSISESTNHDRRQQSVVIDFPDRRLAA